MSSTIRTMKRGIVKNVAAQLISQIARLGSAAIISVVIARSWGVEAYGTYVSTISFVMLFKFAADWGLHRLVIREVARKPGEVNRYVSTGIILIACMSSLTLIFVMLLDGLWGYSDGKPLLIFLAVVWLILGTVGLFFSGVFYAIRRMEFDTMSVVAEATTALLLTAILLINQLESVLLLLCILILSRLVNLSISIYIYLRSIGAFQFSLSYDDAAHVARMAAPFGLMILFVQQSRIPIILLSYFHNNKLAGLYGAAFTIISILPIAGIVMNEALYPLLSRSFNRSKNSFRAVVCKANHYMVVVSVPLTISVILFGKEIILSLYGPAYIGSIAVLQYLSLILPALFINHALSTALTAAGFQSTRTIIVLVGAFTILFIGILLIPQYGLWGAVPAIIVSEYLKLILVSAATLKHIGRFVNPRLLITPTLAATVMTVFLVGFARIRISILMGVVISVLIYGAILILFCPIVRQDIVNLELPNLISGVRKFVRTRS